MVHCLLREFVAHWCLIWKLSSDFFDLQADRLLTSSTIMRTIRGRTVQIDNLLRFHFASVSPGQKGNGLPEKRKGKPGRSEREGKRRATCRTIPHGSLPYHTIPYHTIPYLIIPYRTILKKDPSVRLQTVSLLFGMHLGGGS